MLKQFLLVVGNTFNLDAMIVLTLWHRKAFGEPEAGKPDVKKEHEPSNWPSDCEVLIAQSFCRH